MCNFIDRENDPSQYPSEPEQCHYNDDLTRYLAGEIELTYSDHRDLDIDADDYYSNRGASEATWDRHWDNQGNIHSKFPE